MTLLNHTGYKLLTGHTDGRSIDSELKILRNPYYKISPTYFCHDSNVQAVIHYVSFTAKKNSR